MYRIATFITLVLAAVSASAADLERARNIAHEALIADTHIDVPYRVTEAWVDVTRSTEGGDFDLPRARAGGLDLPFMSIYVPASKETEGGAYQLANQLIDHVEALVARAPKDFAVAVSTEDVTRIVGDGKIALAMGMENGSPIEGDLSKLRHFHERGIRYITLAHSKSNHISDSSYDDTRIWNGLSPFGKAVVTQMNRLGMIVDVSHLSDAAFEDVIEISTAPVLATHSSARHFTPDFERNMSDELISKLAKNGGVIAINFGSAFLTRTANEYSQTYWDARDAFEEEHGLEDGNPELEAFAKAYREENPYPYAELSDVLDHIDHVVKLVGVDHVGIGSDYDGVGDSLPVGLKDVSSYPNLVVGLLDRGYSEEDIRKILGGNVMRVWRAVEAEAAKYH
ncbi:MAG: dipeptidase [Xanthomonadales bacterium]|nr:dipeptidase [Xanthomonadales bacterium]